MLQQQARLHTATSVVSGINNLQSGFRWRAVLMQGSTMVSLLTWSTLIKVDLQQ